jgi:hypothetical protein
MVVGLISFDVAGGTFDGDYRIAEFDQILLPQLEKLLTHVLGFGLVRIDNNNKIGHRIRRSVGRGIAAHERAACWNHPTHRRSLP